MKIINLINLIKSKGIFNLFVRIKGYNYTKCKGYGKWIKNNTPNILELEKQKNTKFSYAPKISIIVPAYHTPVKFFIEMIQSIIEQTYSNWELCIADGSEDDILTQIIKQYYEKDERINYIKLKTNRGIAENANAALNLANGDFIGFVDHDDCLSPNALYEIVNTINNNMDVKIIYTDEDKIDSNNIKRFEPHFKPDFNLELLRVNNYICHLFVIHKDILDKVCVFKKKYEGAQDYDFILRCVESTNQIAHVPKILYHWRMHEFSTARNPNSKKYAYLAGKNAIEDHLHRVGINRIVEERAYFGFYRHKFIHTNFLVSIIITGCNDMLIKECKQDIIKQTTYLNYEICTVNITNHNLAEIMNKSILETRGSYVVFIDSQIRIRTNTWIQEFLNYNIREKVAAVGSKSFYRDNTIRHAGINLDKNDKPRFIFYGKHKNQLSYFHRDVLPQYLNAVSGECMMVNKKIFDLLGGFNKNFNTYIDLELCVNSWKQGYLVVYNPDVEMCYVGKKRQLIYNKKEWKLLKNGLEDLKILKISFNNKNINLDHKRPKLTVSREWDGVK